MKTIAATIYLLAVFAFLLDVIIEHLLLDREPSRVAVALLVVQALAFLFWMIWLGR